MKCPALPVEKKPNFERKIDFLAFVYTPWHQMGFLEKCQPILSSRLGSYANIQIYTHERRALLYKFDINVTGSKIPIFHLPRESLENLVHTNDFLL